MKRDPINESLPELHAASDALLDAFWEGMRNWKEGERGSGVAEFTTPDGKRARLRVILEDAGAAERREEAVNEVLMKLTGIVDRLTKQVKDVREGLESPCGPVLSANRLQVAMLLPNLQRMIEGRRVSGE